MKMCKWCHQAIEPGGSMAFCSKNPNLERNKRSYFGKSKKYAKLHKHYRKSFKKLFETS